VGGGLPTWDVAMDVRLVYDFLCDNAPTLPPIPVSPKFNEAPDYGLTTTNDSDADAQNMALKVNGCFGWLAPSPDSGEAAGQAQRLSDFIELTQFTGYPTPADAINIPSAMGFATLGLGDFVRYPIFFESRRFGPRPKSPSPRVAKPIALGMLIASAGVGYPVNCVSSMKSDRRCACPAASPESGEGASQPKQPLTLSAMFWASASESFVVVRP